MLSTNLLGMRRLAMPARKRRRSFFCTLAPLPSMGSRTIAPSEDELLEPNSDYAITKAGRNALTASW